METLNNIVLTIQNYMSNYILVIALLGAGLWFSIRLGFIQVRGFGESMRRTFGGLFSKKSRKRRNVFFPGACDSNCSTGRNW